MSINRYARAIGAGLCVIAGTRSLDAQGSDCRLILENGLYRVYQINRSGGFQQDLKRYFISEQFRGDLRSKKWGGGLSVVLDAVTIGLSADASEQEVQQFQGRVTQASSLSLAEEYYETAATRVPDVELARVYSKCLEDAQEYGLRVTSEGTERDVMFFLKHRNQSADDPHPVVRFFQVRGARSVFNAPAMGDTIKDVRVITAERMPNEDMTLAIETSRGARAHVVLADPAGFNADMPVGTIIMSYLTWKEFQAITKNNARNPGGDYWASRYSKWAPTDGRDVPNSSFERATSARSVPDLRGRFVRGLNTFDPTVPAATAALGDPENRVRGQYQADDLKTHSHEYREWLWQVNTGSGPYPDGLTANTGNKPSRTTENNPAGAETRPRNVAVYYYIRVN